MVKRTCVIKETLGEGVFFKMFIRKEELKYVMELSGNNFPLGARRKYLGKREGQDLPYLCPVVCRDMDDTVGLMVGGYEELCEP